MKSIQRTHIVLVAGSDHGLVLAARLLQMEAARVTAVASLEEARGMCHAGGADACIIAFDDALPDAPPVAAQDAPGRQSGVPSLMVVPAVTRYQRMAARRQGYFAAVPGTIPKCFTAASAQRCNGGRRPAAGGACRSAPACQSPESSRRICLASRLCINSAFQALTALLWDGLPIGASPS